MDTEITKSNRELDEAQILNKLFRYCSFQERSISDVNRQLTRYNAEGVLKEKIIRKLTEEGFLNEDRYAVSYTLGKLRSNHWGRVKIRLGLKQKSIDNQIINKALESIDKEEYFAIIDKLITRKSNSIQDKDIYIKKHKIARFIIGKGFESHLVWEKLNNHFMQ
jgi:regulatory protein